MEKPVRMFTLSTCSHCKSTKKFLDDCKVTYEFEDVDLLKGEERAAAIEELRKWNPNCNLYVSKEWNEGTIPHEYVPDRRPAEKILG